MFFVRQGATHKIVVGPAVSVSDGFTPVTTLALNSADEAEAILHDNGTVVDIGGYTFAAITTADGYYHLTLQSGISNTVGHVTIVINDDSLILPIRTDFTVVEEAVYDNLFASSAVGPLAANSNGSGLTEAGGTGDQFTAIEDIVWDTISADHLTAGTLGLFLTSAYLDTNELQADWTNGGRLDLLIDDIVATLGDPSDLGNGATVAANLADMAGETFSTTTDSQEAIRNRGDAAWTTGAGGSAPTVEEIRQEMDANSTKLAAIVEDTDELQGNQGNWLTSTGFSTHSAADVWAVGTRVLTAATNITSTGGTTVPQTGDSYARLGAPAGASVSADVAAVQSSVGGLNNLSAAQVNAEVVDALSTDTYAEPGQGAPSATLSLAAKIGYLFKAWRNKHTQDADDYNLYADDGTTVDQNAAVSDDGTTFERGEMGTGA